MKRLVTFGWMLVAAAAVVLLSGQTAHAQTFSLDLATAGANGVAEDDLLMPGPGVILPGALGLPPAPPPPPPAEVDALSFGHFIGAPHTVVGVEFSVTPGSIGAAGTAVLGESGGAGFADEPADIYGSGLGGGNLLLWDGDGVPAPGAPLIGALGVIEPGSNVDAWDATPPFGPVPGGIHWTVTGAVAAGHPAYAPLLPAPTGSFIFFSPPVPGYSVLPALYATDVALGLLALDDIDALAIVEDGVGGFTAGDTIYFSLAPGSPTLGLLGATPGDILSTTIAAVPVISIPHFALGLLPGDDVDALDLALIPEPASAALLVGLATTLLLRRRRD